MRRGSVGVALDEGQGLQHRVVEVGGDLGPVVGPYPGGPFHFERLDGFGSGQVVAAEGGGGPAEDEGGGDEDPDVAGRLSGRPPHLAEGADDLPGGQGGGASQGGPEAAGAGHQQQPGQGVAAEEQVAGAGDEGEMDTQSATRPSRLTQTG